MDKTLLEILEIVAKAREYDETKSITTATDVCKMLIEWADKLLEREADDEQ